MAKEKKIKPPVVDMHELSSDELLFKMMPSAKKNREIREFDEKAEKSRLAKVRKHDVKHRQ